MGGRERERDLILYNNLLGDEFGIKLFFNFSL